MDKEKKARIIKRYQNRKLYDTQNSCYVTLDDIAKFIKAGEDVAVIDNKNHEDLTSVTLTQIILEEGKKKKHLLPLNTLKDIIASSGEQIANFVKSVSISNVRGEAEKVIDKIKDEIGDGSSFIKDFFTKSHQGVDEVSKKLEDTFRTVGKLTNAAFLKTEIRAFRKKVADLERKLRHFDKK